MQTTDATIEVIEILLSKISYGIGSVGDHVAAIGSELDDLRSQLQTERAELRHCKTRIAKSRAD